MFVLRSLWRAVGVLYKAGQNGLMLKKTTEATQLYPGDFNYISYVDLILTGTMGLAFSYLIFHVRNGVLLAWRMSLQWYLGWMQSTGGIIKHSTKPYFL
jgi:hypothetical protein